jgi:mannose-1-phosphate guanylyltransferase/mannose-6-phosphate isomerase
MMSGLKHPNSPKALVVQVSSMSAISVLPVIMSGGSGTRLWPLSTSDRPKQFHALGAQRTMIQETALRLASAETGLNVLGPAIIGNIRHADLIASQLAEVGISPTFTALEPVGRNTAATAAAAAQLALEYAPGALVLLMPADHVVSNPAAFLRAISVSAETAKNRIVTFGMRPTGPETGYGYIKQGRDLADGVHEVAAFREKPVKEVAETYLQEGGYSWNSGVFFFDPTVMLNEFSLTSPDIRDRTLDALRQGVRHDRTLLIDAQIFATVRSAPIDIAVMEPTQRAAVTPCDIGWADVGSWSELWRLSEQDASGNVTIGPSLIVDGSDNLVRSEGIHVSVAGVSGLVVVATKDGILIIPKERAQDVGKLIPGRK